MEYEEREFDLLKSNALLTERDWDILIDLYEARIMQRRYLMQYHFNESSSEFYSGYNEMATEEQRGMDKKNENRLKVKASRTIKRLIHRGYVQSIKIDIPNRSETATNESWYALTSIGIRAVEKKLWVPEDQRVNKYERDNDFVNFEHQWEISKLYLQLNHEWELGDDWDWYSSHVRLSSDTSKLTIRPDATLRIDEQLFFIEMDLSTENIRRRKQHSISNQTSIESKLKAYKQLMGGSKESRIQKGIILFLVPKAKRGDRIHSILQTAKEVYKRNDPPVMAGRTIEDVFNWDAAE